jgi:signal transduction histidine kinase
MKEVGRFLRLLTHDLQNQAGAIDLNLQMLPTMLPGDHPSAEFISRAAAASSDLISVLEDVQYFARAVSRADDGEGVTVTRCDLSAKVRNCALTLGSAAQSRKVTLKTLITGDVYALGESDSIIRAIRILTGEALRSAFSGATVEMIVTASPVPAIEISVSLEGIFDENRTTLATYLAKEILRASKVTMLLISETGRSRAQLLFQPA